MELREVFCGENYVGVVASCFFSLVKVKVVEVVGWGKCVWCSLDV